MADPVSIVRPFCPADASAVDTIAQAAFAQYKSVYSDFEILMRGVSSMSALASTAEILVAELDGAISGAVGYVGPNVSPRAEFFESSWSVIRMLVVHPSARGHGLGRLLTQECIKLAQRDEAAVIALHTSPVMEIALGLYLRMGFHLHRWVPDRFGVPYAVYLKHLKT